MKRKEFIRELEQSGCVLHRHGSRHKKRADANIRQVTL